jgi:hypothetical protein
MPNHITNRLKFIGTDEQVKLAVEKYSTFNDKKPRKSYDGKFTYEKEGEKYALGWLDKETGIFSRRNMEDVKGVPVGYKQDFEDVWTAMPDFNKVIPQPNNIFHGALGNKEKEMCAKEGRPTWYEWNIKYWGTKWGGYTYEKISDNEFEFQTAWSSVPLIIHAISIAFPDLEIDYKYADEDTGSNVGHLKFKQGKEMFRNIPDNGSTEAFTLAFELNPDDGEYYELIDGEWTYKEEA